MLHPLVSLWRHSCRVTFYENSLLHGGLQDTGSSSSGFGPGVRRRFRNQDDALTYLRYWAGDPGAQADLRWMSQRLDAPQVGKRQGPTPWLEPLAALLAGGGLLVVEESASRARPGRLVAPPSAASATALDALPSLSSLPQVPVVPNLLPALEDIQVEGAEVLPELDEAMARIAQTLDSVDTAGASLEPAPSRVADIQAAMDKAAAQSQQGLSDA